MFENTEKIIDVELATEILDGRLDMAKRMIKMLVDRLAEDKRMIEESYKNKEFERLSRIAHKLYGATCYCGVPRLKSAVKNLENAALEKKKSKDIFEFVKIVYVEIDSIICTYENNSELK